MKLIWFKSKMIGVELRGSGLWTCLISENDEPIKSTWILRSKRIDQEFWDKIEQSFSSVSNINHLKPLSKKEKHAKFFAKYKTYEGERGNIDQWKEAAQLLLSGKTNSDEFLKVLGLDSIPKTKIELTKARRKVMMEAHPDHGGSVELSQLINEAFEELERKIK